MMISSDLKPVLVPDCESSRNRAPVIPLFSESVQAGFASPAESDSEGPLDLNQHLIAHPAATFFVRVVGDSMRNAGILSGDLLIVDRSLTANDGSIVIAIINAEFTVKRLKMQGKKISLVPENPAYPIVEIKEGTDFQVWGVVTYVIHKAE